LEYGKELIKKHADAAEKTLANISFKDISAQKGLQSLIAKISDLKI
jgi:hypothetical protein